MFDRFPQAIAMALVVLTLGIAAGAFIGWVTNLVKLFSTLNDPLTAMELARGIGIFVPPIGAVLGWI